MVFGFALRGFLVKKDINEILVLRSALFFSQK